MPVLASLLSGLTLAACGSAKHVVRPQRAAGGQAAASAANVTPVAPGYTRNANGYVTGDGDDDPHNLADDREVRRFGHPASPITTQTVARLVRRYFKLAMQGDGTAACPLLSSRLARSHDLPASVPTDYASPMVARLPRQPCGRFLAGLFRLSREQLQEASVKSLAVTLVRVNGPTGLAVLAFTTAPERYVVLRREHGAWKMGSLLDLPIT